MEKQKFNNHTISSKTPHQFSDRSPLIIVTAGETFLWGHSP